MKVIRNLAGLVVITTLMFSAFGLKAQNPQQGQGQQQEIEVSDSELEAFANIMQEIQEAQKQAQNAIVKDIEDNPDISIDRYQKIAQAQQQGSEVDMSEKENQAYSAIQQVRQEEQQKLDKKVVSILEGYEMDRERYLEINQALRSDKKLQKRFQQLRQPQGNQPKQ